MRVTQIASHEADFDLNGADSSGKVFQLTQGNPFYLIMTGRDWDRVISSTMR